MNLKRWKTAWLLSACLGVAQAFAQNDGVIQGLGAEGVPCEVAQLSATPPKGWRSVAIESSDDAVLGCQMALVIEGSLYGFLRLLSFEQSTIADNDVPWYQQIVSFETKAIFKRGYTLGEFVSSEKDIPVSGSGFKNARSLVMSATLENNSYPQQVQFLVFESETHKYLLTLLTPEASVQNGAYYQQNMAGKAAVMQSLVHQGAATP